MYYDARTLRCARGRLQSSKRRRDSVRGLVRENLKGTRRNRIEKPYEMKKKIRKYYTPSVRRACVYVYVNTHRYTE